MKKSDFMRLFFAYIRVSTAKQSERGVSLQEQRDAIANYAKRHGLEISEWFEERVTAAKRGRTIFNQMLRLLQKRKVEGVIIHKIDRSARNLRDWAELGELIDRGITVHFANENLDLYTRGGRLSADIQAVVAADFIRNLREEVKKGFYGRLKQGLYPLPAPLGYLDRGKGNVKEIDPEIGPAIKRVFEIYATGTFGLRELVSKAHEAGLRTRSGGKLGKTSLAYLLTNPFYMGIIRVKRNNEVFTGAHQPIISKALFDSAQAVLQGKATNGLHKHDYLFRRTLACSSCNYSLIGERQKGRVYYRCQTRDCPTTCVREDAVERAIIAKLLELQLSTREKRMFEIALVEFRRKWELDKPAYRKGLQLTIGKIRERLSRLTDAFLDGEIDRDAHDLRRNTLLIEQKGLEGRLLEFDQEESDIPAKVANHLELATTAFYQYNLGFVNEKRRLLKILTSNRLVNRKDIEFTWNYPYKIIAERPKSLTVHRVGTLLELLGQDMELQLDAEKNHRSLHLEP